MQISLLISVKEVNICDVIIGLGLCTEWPPEGFL